MWKTIIVVGGHIKFTVRHRLYLCVGTWELNYFITAGGLLASAGGEDGSIATTANGQKMLSRSSLDEHSLLLGSPLLDNSQVRFITNVT
ncbi:unnamed protein product [Onchocerca flexuosa]|uniref:Uncharacterized protein n=1 Tax=Onchocerca flexuosa TaxID=387005 RepID=A0A183HNG3_9BILA|nr:unnamed protein product [Onchocerca flexuosa]